MVCEQHEADRTAKRDADTGLEERVAPSMVQMEA